MRTHKHQGNPNPVRRLLTPDMFTRQLTPGLIVMVCAVGIFALIAVNVFTHGALVNIDIAVTLWFQAHSQPTLTRVMWYVTQLHSNLGIASMTAVVSFLLYRRGDRFWYMALASSVLGGMLLNAGLKLLFQRPRPLVDHPLLNLATYSFPSGHTMNATVFYGVLTVLIVTRCGLRYGLGAMMVSVLMVALVATSRIYLGVHFLSDVLAAVVEGIAWIAFCLTALNVFATRRKSCE